MFESLYEQISAKNAIRYMVYPLWNAPLAGYIAGWLIVILISILSAWITWHVSDKAVSKVGTKAVWYRWIGTVIAGGFSLWLSLPIIQMAYQVRTPQQLLLAGMFFWLAVTALVVFILMKCFRPLPLIRKTRDYRDYYLRGSRLVDSEQFNRINRKAFAFEQEKIEPLKVGKLLIPTAAESYHFAVLGATGSGKSQVMLPFIRTINRRNQSMIVFDIGGDFWRRCRREQDVFFNPLVTGKGGFAWNPLKEIQKPEDCDMLAAAICSTNESDASGKRWTEYARTFVSGCLRAMNYSADIEQFLYLLTEATPEELAGYLSGTPAAGFVQENNEETFQSIRTTVIRFIQAWQFMIPDIHAHPDQGVSLREWIRERSTADNSKAIYLSIKDSQMATFKNLFATFYAVAIQEALDIRKFKNRFWLFMDEADSLDGVSSLKDGLTKLRKHNVSILLGFQTETQLKATYGADITDVLLVNARNKIIMNCQGSTAETVSKWFGKQEIKRVIRTKSENSAALLNTKSGGDTVTSGSNISIITTPVVLPSEISGLENLHGYMMITGGYIARFKAEFSK